MLNLQDLDDADQGALYAKRVRDRDSWGLQGPLDGPVNLGEVCWLERLHRGENLKACAERLGVSHVTLIKRERGYGRVSLLADHWPDPKATPARYWSWVDRP